jgi:Zn-dependent M16 (insulinase) family peptidase
MWCEAAVEPVVVNKSLPTKAGDSLADKTATTSSSESAVIESSLDGFTQIKSLRELRRG